MTKRSAKPARADSVDMADTDARDLGHVPRRSGRTFSCWHCACEGLVGPDGARIGSIFERSCAR